MGRFERCASHSGRWCFVPASWLAGFLVFANGCGGGSQDTIQPPPPAPDFSVVFSPAAITVSQGSTSSAVMVSVTPQNGFSGSVQVSLSTLPSGVTANPSGSFSVSPDNNASLIFSASASAVVGAFTLTATSTGGSITHTGSLGLMVQTGNTAAFPRSTYIRTDAIAALDDPPGELHHRHLALDVARGHLFVANRAKNTVEVLATPDGSRVSEIVVPGASSVDLSTDGATVWVGSTLQTIYELDAASLQLRAAHVLDGLEPVPGITFDRPEEVFALAGGKLVVRLREAAGSQSLLVLWDPASNSVTNLTSAAPQVFQSGLGVMAKSADGTRLIVSAADASGEIALFDGSGSLIAGPLTIGGGSVSYAAANSKGTEFALLFSGAGGAQALLFGSSLNLLGSYGAVQPRSLLFSSDDANLLVSEQFGTGFVVSLLDVNDFHLLKRVSDLAVAGSPTQIEAADKTELLFGIANRGVVFLDGAVSASLSQTAPAFSSAPIAQPSTGPNSGGTSTVLSGTNFELNPAIQFGSQSATIQSSGATQLQISSPANASAGAVNVSALFPDGWSIVAPDAFSYGPQVLRLLPNAGNKNGNETIGVYGYGFGTDPSKLTVKIGGATATVQKIDQVPALSSSLGLDATYPFPLQRAVVTTPAGPPGSADIFVSSPSGSATLTHGFAYLQSEQINKHTGFYKFLLYDQKRNRLYLSNIDHVDVFDLTLNTFVSTIQPPGGPPPNSGLRGLALSPDSSQLAIADFGAQSIYLMNPDTATGSATFVGGISGYANSGPSLVAATSAKTIFVGMSAEGGTQPGCSNCIALMDVSTFPPTVAPATQPEVSFLTGSPLLQGDSSGDHVFFSFASAPGGPVASWNASSPGQFQTFTANASAMDLAVALDGNAFAIRESSQFSFRSSNLNLFGCDSESELENIPGRTEVPGAVLHSSGALLYVPFLTGPAPMLPTAANVTGGVDIRDARTGALRLRIFLPEPFAMLSSDINGQHGRFLTIDETGQRLFALTSSGVTILQLASVPLGVGSLNPASGPAAGGTSVTLRGSGFQSGTKLTVGGKSVSATFKDMNTLTFTTPAVPAGAQQIVLTNPNGETVSIDAAFTAN